MTESGNFGGENPWKEGYAENSDGENKGEITRKMRKYTKREVKSQKETAAISMKRQNEKIAEEEVDDIQKQWRALNPNENFPELNIHGTELSHISKRLDNQMQQVFNMEFDRRLFQSMHDDITLLFQQMMAHFVNYGMMFKSQLGDSLAMHLSATNRVMKFLEYFQRGHQLAHLFDEDFPSFSPAPAGLLEDMRTRLMHLSGSRPPPQSKKRNTVQKMTSEELIAPKREHVAYLIHCTNEPNEHDEPIPFIANLLTERTQHPSCTVVYKALIAIHNLMCYGNERFSQYFASCSTSFNVGNLVDKTSTSGNGMSQHVRWYGKYIEQKSVTYRTCVFDFCKDGILGTMDADKLLKTLPILQNQIDALLEFQVSSSELNNGVINCSFTLLFRDLIRLIACNKDGIVNLLEKYFDFTNKQCKDALDTYKGFLTRLDKVADFLRVAESIGIDAGEIPNLTRAPAGLLDALEAHLSHLEDGRLVLTPAQVHAAHSQLIKFLIAFQAHPTVGDNGQQRHQQATLHLNPLAADGVHQYGAYGAQAYGAPQMQWGMQQPRMYGMPQQPMQPYAMYQPMGMVHNMQTMGQQQMAQAPASSVQQPKDPFSGF